MADSDDMAVVETCCYIIAVYLIPMLVGFLAGPWIKARVSDGGWSMQKIQSVHQILFVLQVLILVARYQEWLERTPWPAVFIISIPLGFFNGMDFRFRFEAVTTGQQEAEVEAEAEENVALQAVAQPEGPWWDRTHG